MAMMEKRAIPMRDRFYVCMDLVGTSSPCLCQELAGKQYGKQTSARAVRM